MNAANNLALAQRGTVVVNHDNQGMNEPATKQDLPNLRTDMNSGFDKVYSRFEIVDSQFANLRTDMDAKFDKAQVALNKTLLKFGSLYFTMMFAVLSVERWWR